MKFIQSRKLKSKIDLFSMIWIHFMSEIFHVFGLLYSFKLNLWFIKFFHLIKHIDHECSMQPYCYNSFLHSFIKYFLIIWFIHSRKHKFIFVWLNWMSEWNLINQIKNYKFSSHYNSIINSLILIFIIGHSSTVFYIYLFKIYWII